MEIGASASSVVNTISIWTHYVITVVFLVPLGDTVVVSVLLCITVVYSVFI